jgi:hypothetical protein
MVGGSLGRNGRQRERERETEREREREEGIVGQGPNIPFKGMPSVT